MPPIPLTRRQALQAVGSPLVLSFGGRATASDGDDPPSPTTERSGTRSPTATGTATETPLPELSPVTSDDFSFDVELLEQFTEEHPARIEASFENVGEQPVTVTGGPTVPFGFSSGNHAERDATLLTIPHDNSHLITESSGDRLVPRESTSGCWTVDYELRS